jgi:hypothetical protein
MQNSAQSVDSIKSMQTLHTVAMSADGSAPTSGVSTTDSPRYGYSASYLPCRECGEGSLVYDESLATTVCRCCGAIDD